MRHCRQRAATLDSLPSVQAGARLTFNVRHGCRVLAVCVRRVGEHKALICGQREVAHQGGRGHGRACSEQHSYQVSSDSRATSYLRNRVTSLNWSLNDILTSPLPHVC